MTTTEALGAWGAYDRDDPVPAVRRGPRTGRGACGHARRRARRLAGGRLRGGTDRAERSAALQGHARRAGDRRRGRGRGPARARPSPGTCSASTRRITAACAASSRPRSRRAASKRCARGCRPSSTTSSTRSPRPGPTRRVDLVAAFAFPLPFTVICELLGVPEPDRAALGRGLTALLVPTSTAEEYARAKEASDAVVAMLDALVDAKQASPGDDLVSGLISARDGDERLSTQELLSTIFQLIVAGHDTTASLIGNGVVALLAPSRAARRCCAPIPPKLAVAVEELLRYDAPVPHSTFRYAVEPIDIGGVTIPAGAQVIISLAAANRDQRTVRRPGRARHRSRREPPPRVRARHPSSASARRSLAWRASSHSGRCCAASRSSASPSPSTNCTGATATDSCFAVSPSCQSSPVLRSTTRRPNEVRSASAADGLRRTSVHARSPHQLCPAGGRPRL